MVVQIDGCQPKSHPHHLTMAENVEVRRQKLSIRSPMEELPCLLRFDWSKPIDAESGRGNGLGRSENKRPETRRSWN
ncbi:hypothetical protein TNCV_1941771 [Trichonephila clavipes]|uniref:Uncharacterized protein n=1 Tax=Trichonephila clavipes TaxID=2585209 RepID=A0A8X6V8Z0_TRICX|nr:hypothetical protein TNCV_1941771 [Trichonephila clavipes]